VRSRKERKGLNPGPQLKGGPPWYKNMNLRGCTLAQSRKFPRTPKSDKVDVEAVSGPLTYSTILTSNFGFAIALMVCCWRSEALFERASAALPHPFCQPWHRPPWAPLPEIGSPRIVPYTIAAKPPVPFSKAYSHAQIRAPQTQPSRRSWSWSASRGFLSYEIVAFPETTYCPKTARIFFT